MCSNNQSSIPSGENTPHYDRDELARDLLAIYVPTDETLGDALHSNLSHIKEQCETVRQICLESPVNQRVDISTDDLHGFLSVQINQIQVAQLLASRLSSLEMRFNSKNREYQQAQNDLEEAQETISSHEETILELENQIAATSKNKAGEA